MNPDEIRLLIAEEVRGDWERTNLHGCVLRNCLVEPRKINVFSQHSDGPLEVWLVLKEHPAMDEGYAVFYDENERRFGLAFRSNPDNMVHVGHYGGFLEAFDGM